MLYLFQIRAADSAGAHTNQNFAVANLRDGNVLGGHLPGAAIYTRAHFCGKRFGIFRRCDEMGGHAHVAATISDCERSSRALSNSR